MATVEEALCTKLLSLAAVSALTTRIRPDRLDQLDTLPAIVIAVDSEQHDNDLSGNGGLVRAQVRIRCAAETRAGSRALHQAVRVNGAIPGTGLAGFEGTVAGVELQACVLERSQLDFIPYEDGGDAGVYVVDGVYQVEYTETV